MKKNIIQVLCLSALLSVTACKDVLDEKPQDFISTDQIGNSTEKDAELWVNGALNTINNDFLYGAYPRVLELDQDHISGPAWIMATIGSGNFQGDPSLIDRMWIGPYMMIHRCNLAIPKVSQMKIDEGAKNNALGQLYFLRGWAYFQLVRAYGPVPIFKKSVSEGESVHQPRAAVKEVYDHIIENLTSAESKLYSLKEPKYKVGRISKGAASTLLAKVYLTMASGALSGAQVTVLGGPATKTAKGITTRIDKPVALTHTKAVVAGHEGMDAMQYFQLARDKAKEVITSGEYDLFPNYGDIWKVGNRNQREHIWSLQSISGDAAMGNVISFYYAGTQVDNQITGGRFLGERNHWYESFEKTDRRITEGASKENIVYLRKFEGVSDRKTELSDFPFPFLRYADVLLMFAEAENELNGGPTADVYEAVNSIRRRNKATEIKDLNQLDFRSFVLEERGRELALEGNRRWDLLRWGIYLPVMNAVDADENNVLKRRQPKHLLYPIPVNEINANKFINENNPGW